MTAKFGKLDFCEKPPTPSSSPTRMIAASPLSYSGFAALYAKGIGGGSRRRVTCGWYAKNLLRVYARMWGGCPPHPPFGVGETPVSTRRRASLHAL